MMTIKDFDNISRQILNGNTLTHALTLSSISAIDFFKYLNDNPTQKTEFELARQIALERSLDESIDSIDSCDGDIDIKKVTLKLRTLQWQCEKLIPQVYGPRLDVNVHKTIDIRGVLEDARRRVYVSSDVISVESEDAVEIEDKSAPVDIKGYSDILG